MLNYHVQILSIGSFRFGKMEIKGNGTVGPDRTSLDIHIEITNTTVSQPLKPRPIQGVPSAVTLKVNDHTVRKIQPNFLNKPVFGKETGKALPSLLLAQI